MKKEDILKKIGTGWHSYIELVYNMLPDLPFTDGLYVIERKNGMLRIIFLRTVLTTTEQDFILKSIEYKIERLTAKVCEECGEYGLRRTELSEVKTLCTRCYAFEYSKINPVPSLVANQKPHLV